ncbi:hypothetical protein [Mesorhizobium australafricanum]|uniref:Uncharacterized protein n=1 Tax=Mesorhizobium australafricanum TaxID=3072311 RepID=A0ABU4WSG1_9HYPH|nr:hypothetical protein [Mesorhizobium sp. VK3E]MDX8438426.1 hypothetical protein [Mesorhizobium sp. VK3E]
MSHIVVHDQIGARKPVRNFVMEWNDGVPCTVRELIAERVRYEYDKVHADLSGLSANEIVNLPNLFLFDKISAEKAIEKALSAFQKNGFMLFADARQLSDLDETIAIMPRTDVTFIRLVPLKGG